ncbi:MAG TPA: DHH family phosphoesterase [Thermoplasmata archaeon]|nr:DHH family phosphoesterase [Thermoplasmata archaeon]
MPSGPDGFVADPAYRTEFERARGLVLGHPGRWRVIYHYDADGIASASSILRAFSRLGYAAQATALSGVERERMAELLRATASPVLVADTGASWLDLYGGHPHPVVVLDHHQYPGVPTPPALPSHVALVNPLDWGVDGMSEMCAATLSWLFTIFLDPRNWDNAAWGLSGGIGDRQHVGGFRGLNRLLVDEAVRRSLVVRRAGLPLFGASVGAAVSTSIDPFVRGLSGHPSETAAFLASVGVEADRSPASLSPEESARLASALRDRLVATRVPPEALELIDQERWFLPALGLDAEEVSNRQSAAGRARSPGLGIAFALGDRAAAERLRRAEEGWRGGILKGLLRLEEEGVNSMSFLQWFESPDTTLAGTQAGMAILYLLDPNRPVFVLSHGERGPSKVSARATRGLVERGLDLAAACREAARSVGGEGGGHRIASGATIPAGAAPAFLEAADRVIGGQIAPVAGVP